MIRPLAVAGPAVAAFTGYVGRYTVDTARRVVTHAIEGEWPPRRGPIESVTPYELRGDTLLVGRASGRWTLVRVRE